LLRLASSAEEVQAAGAGRGLYFERLEKKLMRRSDAIVCIAPGFADFIRTWDSGVENHGDQELGAPG